MDSLTNSKSCICVPICKADFLAGIKLADSFLSFFTNECLVFIFSTNEEKQEFLSYHNSAQIKGLVFDPMFLTTHMETSTHARTGSLVTRKKLFGIYTLFKLYDNLQFIACVDKDVLIIKTISLFDVFKEIFESKIFYCNIATHHFVYQIIKDPLLYFFDILNVKKITEEIILKKNYFWFNQIPIYEKKSFEDFFAKIKHKDFMPCQWTLFDYILYGYYLMSHYEFNTVNLQHNANNIISQVGFLESQHELCDEVFKSGFNQITPRPCWIKTLNSCCDSTNIFMLLHTDRINTS